jgi:hypothetical protein
MHFSTFTALKVSCSCFAASRGMTHRCRVSSENGHAVDHAVCERMHLQAHKVTNRVQSVGQLSVCSTTIHGDAHFTDGISNFTQFRANFESLSASADIWDVGSSMSSSSDAASDVEDVPQGSKRPSPQSVLPSAKRQRNA